MVSIQTWRTDITNEQSFVYLKCKQYDAYSRKYRMIITDKGIPQVLNSNEHTVYIRMWKKGDSTPYVNKPLDWENGFPVVELKGSMLSKDGVIDVDFAIHSNITNSIVSTRIQHIDVQKSLLNYDGLIESEEFEILSHLMNQINEVPYFVEESRNELNELLTIVNQDIKSYKTDYSSLKTQIDTWFANTKYSYDVWYNSTKNTYDSWLSTTKNNYDTWYVETKNIFDNWFSSIESSYNTWFTNTKDEYTEWFEGAKFEYALSLETSQADYVAWVKKVKEEYDTWYQEIVSVYNETQSTVNTWFENTKTNYEDWYSNTTSDYDSWYDDTKRVYSTWYDNTVSNYNDWYTNVQSESNSLITQVNSDINTYETDFTNLKTDIETLQTDVSNWYSDAQLSENSRTEAESSRVEAETARIEAENARIDSETIRVDAESIRETNESQRQLNTATAISNCEAATISANSAAENANKAVSDAGTTVGQIQNEYNTWYSEAKENYNTWYTEAQSAENLRIDEESQRSEAESQRSEAESQRKANEELRQSNYSTAISNCETATRNANVVAYNLNSFVNGYKSIELGNFVNMVESSESGIYLTEENNYIASSESTIGVPYYGCTFVVQCNDNYRVKIRFGKSHNDLTVDSGWLSNRESYTVIDNTDANYTYFRVYVTHVDNMETETIIIDSSSIYEDSNVKVLYKSKHDVLKANVKANKKTALKRSIFNANTSNSNPYKYPVIVHITDTHGDTVRVQNAVEYAEGIHADYIFASGDIVSYRPANGYSSVVNALLKSNVPVIMTPGNHDVYKLEQSVNSDVYIYNNLIRDLSHKFEYVHDENAITYLHDGTPSSYFYVDNDKYLLRIISINEYEKLGASEIGWIKHMNQPQVDFIINAMTTTPDGYSIVFVYHEPDEVPVGHMDTVQNNFYQHSQAWTSGAIGADFKKSIINTLVDAFNNKTTLNTTISQTGTYSDVSTYTNEVSLVADFSSTTSKFVGHFTGHWHTDCVMNMPNTETNQLLLNLTSTTVHCGRTWGYAELADGSDVPRIPTDETQDSFNIYVIDKDNIKVHIIRVGSDETFYDDEKYMYRDYLEMDYNA